MSKFPAMRRRQPLNLSPGYPPWQPLGTVRLLVFEEDRGALQDGILLLGEHQQYLFTRILDDWLAGTGLYAYVPLSRRMLGRLQNTSGLGYARRRERYLRRRGILYANVAGTGEAQRITGPAEPPEHTN